MTALTIAIRAARRKGLRFGFRTYRRVRVTSKMTRF